VVGAGAVGSRAARQLVSSTEVDEVVVCDQRQALASSVCASLGSRAVPLPWDLELLHEASVLVVAVPNPVAIVRSAVGAAVPAVAVTDNVHDVKALLSLDDQAKAQNVPIVIGAGMAPGLTCVLARFAATHFSEVEEIHVGKTGTGGPACARQHHRALGAEALDWREGEWARRPGGSGRELYWFPDPVGGQDCYRAGLADSLLLVPAFPGVRRVTSRVAASRRDRITAGLPMVRRPHPEGEIGAVRVEVRGRRGSRADIEILGAIDRPAVAAGAVAAVAAVSAATGKLVRTGAGGLAELLDEPAPFLNELARRGVKAAVFEGAGP
jgi:hypothetical protein